MNKYLILIFVLIFSMDLRAQLSFGYIDRDAVLENLPEVVDLSQRLEQYGESLTNETDSLENVYRSIAKEMQGIDPKGPERAKYENMQIRLMSLEETLEIKTKELNQRYQQRQQQLLSPFFKKFDRALDEIALENGVQVILDRSYTPESFHNALESESVADLTEQVTQRLLEYE